MIRPLRNFVSALRRHRRLALLLLLLLVLGASAPALFLWSEHHRDAAQRALASFAFDEAQHHLDLCLKVRPRNTELRLLAAQTARRRDDYEEAERQLTECIQLGGMTSATALERMLLTAQQGELDGIETTLRARTAADDPDAGMVLEALAKGFANRYWDHNTLVCLNILLERRPDHPQALLMRARVWENRARKGEMELESNALLDFEKAVELNPSFEAQLGLAGSLYRVGRLWDALQVYERLRPTQPSNPHLLLGLARCRYMLHELDEARRLLDELLEKSSAESTLAPVEGADRLRMDALMERGRMELHEDHLDAAEKALRQAAAIAPRYSREAQRLLYHCLEAADKTSEARACLHEVQEREAKVLELERQVLRANREPHDVALRYQIATELMDQGRAHDSVAALYFILEQQPRHFAAHKALAEYFERTGQSARAARHRRAIFSSPHTSVAAP